MKAISTLPAITALARAGAVDRAWELFIAGGYDQQSDHPAALAVHGRLLKDRARAAEGTARQTLFAQAAAAYSRAHSLGPAPYLAINAATAQLLAGDSAASQTGATQVLALLDSPEPHLDTPYFLAATRAEALLLLGRTEAAEVAMALAAQADPDGWTDRATSLAQLQEICAARGSDCGWLNRFAPPASLHFAGHMGVASGGSSEAALAEALGPLLAARRTGFAWGALAAGADVVIAEKLLDAGVAIHAVLPCPPAIFAAQSVAPAGPAWAARFEAVLARASSVSWASEGSASVHDPLATALAGELAIGGALANARALRASAWQLIVTDNQGGGPNTARQADLWPQAAGEQVRISTPRDMAVDALFPPEQPDPGRQLSLHLAIALDHLIAAPAGMAAAELAAMAEPVTQALAVLPQSQVRAPGPGQWEVLADDPASALRAVQDMLAASRAARTVPPAIGAHLAITTRITDPASGALIPFGPAMAVARRLQTLAPAGAALASAPLVAALATRALPFASELYLPDDEECTGPVYALKV